MSLASVVVLAGCSNNSGSASPNVTAEAASTAVAAPTSPTPSCPTASTISAAVRYPVTGGPSTPREHTNACDYRPRTARGTPVTVFFYPDGTSLNTLKAAASFSQNQKSQVTGIGDAAFIGSDGGLYVYRSTAPSFQVKGPAGEFADTQLEALANDVLTH
ncbi:MAG: hypothetical protein ACLPVY_10270 [Acidimicrobiia bacterium]